MKVSNILRGAFLGALVLLAACSAGPSPLGSDNATRPAGDRPAQQAHVRPAGAPPAAVPAPMDRGFGAVVVEVSWPGRSVQYVPSKTLRFELLARKAGALTAVASASIVFPNRTGKLDRIPAGQASLEGWAYDADTGGKMLASGSVAIDIKPNETVSADLVLGAARPLAITLFSPLNGVTGDAVTVFVKGVVEQKATASIGATGVNISNIAVNDQGDGNLALVVPSTIDNGKIAVSSDGQTAMSADAFVRIASVSLSPPNQIMATGSGIAFVGAAYTRDAGGSNVQVSDPIGMDYTVIDLEPYVAGKPPRQKGTVTSAGVYTAVATGSDLVIFGRIGILTASATVKVQ